MQTPRSSFFWISILVAIAPTKTGVISMDADVAAAMQLRVQSKVKMQVEREIHAETQAAAGLIHQSEARALLERAVYEAVADTREEEQAAARALVDREVTSVVLIRDAEAAAAKALADATLIETIERERQEAMERQAQAVDLAVASTVANERKRVRMTSIVKAVSHAADKKAAVTAAIAAMQKKAAVSSMLKGAANSTKHAEETAKAAEEAAIKRTRDEMQKEHAEQMRAALEEEAAYAAAEAAGAASTGHVQEGEDQGGGGGGGRSLASRMAARAERAALVAELVESEAAVALLSRRLKASEMATEEAILAYEATIADQQAPLWPSTGKKMRPALWERPRSPHAILETMYVHALSSDELRAELFSELLHSSTLPAGLTSKLHATAPLTAVRSRAELVHHGAQHGAHMEPRQPFTIEAAPQIDTSRIISRSKSTASLSSAPRPALQDATTATTTIERRPQPPIAFSKPQPATYSKPSPPLTSHEQLFPPVVASAGVRRDLRAAQVLVPTVTKHGLVWQPQPQSQSQPQPQPQHSGGGGGVGYREAGERSRVAVPALTLTTGRTLREVVFAPA
ncbi:hypothetical protein Ctob_016285 [Chrysochromulina tobinii]|uniref:Uncharacterized protein n=1 Tax=Chrysochromulina tobinii TaxID=1460289 RepID=A0A0M0JZ51_9EUKA|nr:hypothetical protein Ctob_016285 [Chrysochromulina tobinii]|eukprot:KOO31926.1 hypothetical protein Ctob_016285 [Chrysochromulina sp. CCMP291]